MVGRMEKPHVLLPESCEERHFIPTLVYWIILSFEPKFVVSDPRQLML